MGGFAWVTLATNDSYSLGALVLGHSLKRAGTPHDLVVLVTPGVSSSMRSQLSSVYKLVEEVNVLDSRDEAHLALMSRPELGVTFTKLHCWRLTQYEKCVFLDADTLVLKNSDELFEREELSAAPDPGWPDCFNSGVFVYRPSVETFNKLIQFALAKGSFDGGDQGLLNMYFSDWATKDISRHLPFIYNMVSSATYSYLPAFKQFGEEAKIAHFIGATKPWLQYFDSESKYARPPRGSEHMQPLLQLWWDIFCANVHPSLSPEMLGLAGALAQLTLGAPRSAEQVALEEHMRKQAWEQGTMDYMGRDSFDNIWRKIQETLAQAPPKPEVQKATEEVPSTKSAPEPKLPESKLPEPISRKSPPADTGEAGLSSSTAEPTTQATQDTQTKPTGPTPLAPILPSDSSLPSSEQTQSVPVVPHTPSITEATPPTSPPIVLPTADIQALKVEASLLETPPVGSTPSKLVSTIESTHESPIQTPPVAVVTQSQQSPAVTDSSVDKSVAEASILLESAESKLSEEMSKLEALIQVSGSEEASATLEAKVDGHSVPQITPTVTETKPEPSSDTAEIKPVLESQASPVTLVPVSETAEIKPEPQASSETSAASVTTEIKPETQPSSASETAEIKPEPQPSSETLSASETVEIKPEPQPSSETLSASGTAEIKPEPQPSLEKLSASETAEIKPEPQVSSETLSAAFETAKMKQDSQTSPEVGVPISGTAESKKASESQVSSETAVPVLDKSKIENVADKGVPIVLPKTEVPVSDGAEIKAVADKEVLSEQTPIKQEAQVPDKIETKRSPGTELSLQQTEIKSPAETTPVAEKVVTPPQTEAVVPVSAETKLEKTTSVSQPVPQSPPPITLEQEVVPTMTVEASKLPSSVKSAHKEPKASSKGKEDAPKKSTSKNGDKKSAESKSEHPKSPAKQSGSETPPSTPDAPPSDQAPVPPKRKGHKGSGAALTEQGAASKSTTSPQSQQSKGSKSGQKGKK